MAKLSKIKHLAVASFPRGKGEEARIERNLFVREGETLEALRFCSNRGGRHSRVHLVITEQDFASLFAHAVETGVFGEATLAALRAALEKPHAGTREKKGPAPSVLFEVIGLLEDGKLGREPDQKPPAD